VSVPIWPHSISPLIPMVTHALPRMQWALAGAKRLECGSLLPLCLHSQTPCLSPYPIFPISQMTGHATLFDPANRATEHTPVGCGEESPRSCRRLRRNTDSRERGRPRPHQPDDRPYDPFGSRKCGARTFTGWGRARMPALLPALEKPPTVGSAAVLGRINLTTDPTTRLDHANAAPEHSPAVDAHTTCLSPYGPIRSRP